MMLGAIIGAAGMGILMCGVCLRINDDWYRRCERLNNELKERYNQLDYRVYLLEKGSERNGS